MSKDFSRFGIRNGGHGGKGLNRLPCFLFTNHVSQKKIGLILPDSEIADFRKNSGSFPTVTLFHILAGTTTVEGPDLWMF
jgi:hypothetical protein